MASELAPGVPKRIIIAESSRPKETPPGNGALAVEPPKTKHEAEFAKAFAAAQSDFGPIERTQIANVRPRDPNKTPYSFKYAPLDVVLAAVRPALNKHGFALSQRISEDKQWVVTSLVHEHGTRENWYPIFFQDLTSQAYAGSVTYARRYGACLLLGVAAEDDDDGNRGDGNDFDQRPQAEQRKAAARAPAKSNKPMKPAFPVPARSGPTAPAASAPPAESSEPAPDPFTLQAPHAPWAQNPYEPPEDPAEASRVEGVIADAIQDLHEAALEGRRMTIEQVWDELGANHYAKQEIWTRMKAKHPDSFVTVKGVLHPESAAPRKAPARAKK